MSWFNKKEKEEKKQEVPSLPELQNLHNEENDFLKKVPQLPSFPNNDLGEKFSQNTIKDAISGKREGEEVFNVNESEFEEKFPRIPKPQEEFHPPRKEPIIKAGKLKEVEIKSTGKTEPIFIRLDKFEESLKLFEKAKDQITDIEKLLKDVKELKKEEEEELTECENEIQLTKQQIEKIDKNLFSKI